MAMTLRTDEELDAALTKLSESRGVSRQEVLRSLVLAAVAHDEERDLLDAVLDSELPRYAVALERLGQ